MSVLTKEIENVLFELPLQERARLADRLLVSLDAKPSEGWFTEMDEEMMSRISARKQGDVKTSSGKEVLAQLWNSLNE